MKTARVIAVLFLASVSVAAATAEIWVPAPYDRQFRDFPDASPSARFPLGTDAIGRDRLSRLVYGTRVSLLLAPAAALLSCLAAAALGGIAGLAGGWPERLIAAAADLFLSLPWLLLLLICRAVLPLNVSPGVSLAVTFFLLGVLGWAAPAQVVRASVHRLREADFLLHARACGMSRPRLWRQLLPNLRPVLQAQFWVAVPAYILTETTLGMLGLGVAEPLPSWGGLLRELESGATFGQLWLFAPVALLAAVVGSLQILAPRENGLL